jgi:hypothetical protein
MDMDRVGVMLGLGLAYHLLESFPRLIGSISQYLRIFFPQLGKIGEPFFCYSIEVRVRVRVTVRVRVRVRVAVWQ